MTRPFKAQGLISFSIDPSTTIVAALGKSPQDHPLSVGLLEKYTVLISPELEGLGVFYLVPFTGIASKNSLHFPGGNLFVKIRIDPIFKQVRVTKATMDEFEQLASQYWQDEEVQKILQQAQGKFVKVVEDIKENSAIAKMLETIGEVSWDGVQQEAGELFAKHLPGLHAQYTLLNLSPEEREKVLEAIKKQTSEPTKPDTE